jgi:hypothetical protein
VAQAEIYLGQKREAEFPFNAVQKISGYGILNDTAWKIRFHI